MNNEIVSVELENIINEYGWSVVKLNGWKNMDYNFVDGRNAEWFFKMETKLIKEIYIHGFLPIWQIELMGIVICLVGMVLCSVVQTLY